MSKFRLIAYRDGKPANVSEARHYGDGFEAADRAMKADPSIERVEIVQVFASIATPKAAQEPSL